MACSLKGPNQAAISRNRAVNSALSEIQTISPSSSSSSCSSSSPVYCGVSPHLLATLTASTTLPLRPASRFAPKKIPPSASSDAPPWPCVCMTTSSCGPAVSVTLPTVLYQNGDDVSAELADLKQGPPTDFRNFVCAVIDEASFDKTMGATKCRQGDSDAISIDDPD